MKIVFTNTTDLPLDPPQLASKVIPQWYKDSETYRGGEKKPNGNGGGTATIKRCMPVFDAITAGYVFETPCDIYVTQKDEGVWYEWSGIPVEFHMVEQAPLHPARNGNNPYAKITNPWGIQTPKGYSMLFVPPMHHQTPITILEGIVDTDTYVNPVNFPFVLTDPNFEGMIPKGTPIAQLIPIKRENWKSVISTDLEPQNKIDKLLSLQFFDKYKKLFWHRKSYE